MPNRKLPDSVKAEIRSMLQAKTLSWQDAMKEFNVSDTTIRRLMKPSQTPPPLETKVADLEVTITQLKSTIKQQNAKIANLIKDVGPMLAYWNERNGR
jgi:hypothetical protein